MSDSRSLKLHDIGVGRTLTPMNGMHHAGYVTSEGSRDSPI